MSCPVTVVSSLGGPGYLVRGAFGYGQDGTCYAGAGNGLPVTGGFASLTASGTCGCLAGDQEVLLFDGSYLPASDVANGHVLLGFNHKGPSTPQRVSEAFAMVRPCIEIVHEKGVLVCSASHVLVDWHGKEVTARSLCEGAQLQASSTP